MAKRVAIVQSNYIPWRGYFDMIASVDEFVLLDDAQYTRRDWRNRNKIKTAQGTKWLTVPVEVKGKYEQAIQNTRIADPNWAHAHWETIRQTYGRADGFAAHGAFLEGLYSGARQPLLSEVNHHFLAAICRRLDIATALTWSRDYAPRGAKTERLLEICIAAGATAYISGPAAKAYLDESQFEAAGIGVEWFSYGPYAEYTQPHGEFEPAVSIVDVLLCAGHDAASAVRPLAQDRR